MAAPDRTPAVKDRGKATDAGSSKKAEFENKTRRAQADDANKKQLREHEKMINNMVVDDTPSEEPEFKGEPSEEVVLPPADSNNTSPPVGENPSVQVTDTNGETSSDNEMSDDGADDSPDDGREGGPLFTLDKLREAVGQEERGTVIAWKSGDGSRRVVISLFGPQNARRYRLQKAAEADGGWQEDKVPRFTQNSLRFGA